MDRRPGSCTWRYNRRKEGARGYLLRLYPQNWSIYESVNAWVLSKSLETLAVRMDRHCSNALAFATFLETHPAVERVIYPGLQSHPQYELAQKQMSAGGGMVSCVIKGGLEEARNILNDLNIFSLTANLGDARSIATHPASTTHSKTPKNVREAVGIEDGLLRFSLGLETVEDLIGDFSQAAK